MPWSGQASTIAQLRAEASERVVNTRGVTHAAGDEGGALQLLERDARIRRMAAELAALRDTLVARPPTSGGCEVRDTCGLLLQANCRTHRSQKLKCLISLCTNPVSILTVPIQTVR